MAYFSYPCPWTVSHRKLNSGLRKSALQRCAFLAPTFFASQDDVILEGEPVCTSWLHPLFCLQLWDVKFQGDDYWDNTDVRFSCQSEDKHVFQTLMQAQVACRELVSVYFCLWFWIYNLNFRQGFSTGTVRLVFCLQLVETRFSFLWRPRCAVNSEPSRTISPWTVRSRSMF